MVIDFLPFRTSGSRSFGVPQCSWTIYDKMLKQVDSVHNHVSFFVFISQPSNLLNLFYSYNLWKKPVDILPVKYQHFWLNDF